MELPQRRTTNPNYTFIALDGLFSSKQKTHLDDLPPKWLAATVIRQKGCSFGGPKRNNNVSTHQQRLQEIRKRKTKKRSKFSWKKQNNTLSSPTLGSPLSSPPRKVIPTPHIPFNSDSPKTCYFDKYAKPSEDNDPSLYHDKLHFYLRQLAKKDRTDVLDRDKKSWWKATPYIDRSISRDLLWKKDNIFVTDDVTTASEKRKLFMKKRPEDSGGVTMSSTTRRRKGDLESSAMRSKTIRMKNIDPMQSGLGPPQQQNRYTKALQITRPNRLSNAFMSSGREQRVHSRNHKVQLQGSHAVRGGNS